MIDWAKPIETVDGRKARLVETHLENLWHIVYVNPDPDSRGSKPDVFLVNFEGYRCDDRAIYIKRQEPFIRNARVKREGWVLVKPYSDGAPHFGPVRFFAMFATQHIYATEEEAMSAKAYYDNAAGAKAVLFQWEE